MGGHGFGTDIRRGFNARMLGEAIKQPGLDTRCWVSEGTVGTVNTETGDFDHQDKRSIHNDSSGCHVDVRLEPLMIPCTCQYAGIQAGDVTIYAPIRPGNRVKVEFPDGDLTGGIISAILNSRSMRQPTEDGRPIFDNNRLLIHAQSVPIDIRTAGGAQVSMLQDGTIELQNDKGKVSVEPSGTVRLKNGQAELAVMADGSVRLGDGDALDAVVLGTTRAGSEVTELQGLIQQFEGLAITCDTESIPLSAGFRAIKDVLQTFLDALPATLSQKVKTV
jgi:hypothetical protein